MPFVKGQSGNPGGRPKELKAIQDLAREHGPEALKALVKVARLGKSESARVAAAVAVLDRGFGKPHQTVYSTVQRVDADSLSDAELGAYLSTGSSPDTAAPTPDKAKLN